MCCYRLFLASHSHKNTTTHQRIPIVPMSDNAATMDTLIAMMKQSKLIYSTKAIDQYDQSPVDKCARYLMVDWCYKISSFLKFRHDTVAIAVNNLDRYVARRPTTLQSRHNYQLISMACLYNAIKVHEQEAISPALMSQLSKGLHSPQDIEAAEMSVMTILDWKINPPTAMAFLEGYLTMLPMECPSRLRNLIQAQIDVSILDAAFWETDTACIGLEALLIALSLQGELQHFKIIQGLQTSLNISSMATTLRKKLLDKAISMTHSIGKPAPISRQSSKTMSSVGTNSSPRCIIMNS
jgi:Cyclin, N-terminal domain